MQTKKKKNNKTLGAKHVFNPADWPGQKELFDLLKHVRVRSFQ